MLRNLKEFHYPRSVPEALGILERFDSKAAVIAGGTSLGRADESKIEAAVDITRLGLSFVRDDKTALRIGATTTLSDLARSRKLQLYAGGLLARAAASQPSRLIRNGMTLGGSAVQALPSSDLPPALLALDAQMVIAGKTEQLVPIAEFLDQAKYRLLGRTEILTEARLPRTMSGWRGAYQVFNRTHSDPPFVIACAAMLAEGEVCADARVVLGGILKRPQRFPAAEKKLIGKKPSKSHFEQAAKAVAKELDVISDWRASREYRLQIAEVVLARTLSACWQEEPSR